MPSILTIVITLIVATTTIFATRLVIDLVKNRDVLKQESGNNPLLMCSSMVIFFLSSFGICDFAISTVFYRVKKLVSDKMLPGTLNTQCVVPVAVMALTFISTIQVSVVTLISCVISQVIGAYVGPRFVVRLPSAIIRKIIALSLGMVAFFIIASKLSWLPIGGTAMELHGVKLLIAAVALFLFGALNNIGIGSYPLTMATLYGLGMSPLASFPIMMGACAFSTAISGAQFIKLGQYNRKITLFTSTFGAIGVLAATHLIKGLNVSNLQWIIAMVLIYTSIDMLVKEFGAPFKQERVYA